MLELVVLDPFGDHLLLLAAHGLQVVLSGYWLVRLLSVFDDAPGFTPGASFAALTLFFAAGPLVSLGLVLVGSGRRWFEDHAHT